jgi:hypothetical protein
MTQRRDVWISKCDCLRWCVVVLVLDEVDVLSWYVGKALV